MLVLSARSLNLACGHVKLQQRHKFSIVTTWYQERSMQACTKTSRVWHKYPDSTSTFMLQLLSLHIVVTSGGRTFCESLFMQAIAGARPPRFYVSTPLSNSTQSSLKLEDDEARHAYVLRLKAGDQLELCDGLGWTQHCEISVCDKAGTSVRCLPGSGLQ